MLRTQGRLSKCHAGSRSGPSCVKAPGGPELQGTGARPAQVWAQALLQGWPRAAGAGRRAGQPALPLPSLQGQGGPQAEEAPLGRIRACSSAPFPPERGTRRTLPQDEL